MIEPYYIIQKGSEQSYVYNKLAHKIAKNRYEVPYENSIQYTSISI